jgi:hypothetical protein
MRLLSGNLSERDHLEKLIVELRIILNVALRKRVRMWGLG